MRPLPRNAPRPARRMVAEATVLHVVDNRKESVQGRKRSTKLQGTREDFTGQGSFGLGPEG